MLSTLLAVVVCVLLLVATLLWARTRSRSDDLCEPEPAPRRIRWPLRICWEDTDAGGVVFYANYLKPRSARTEWLRTLGFSQQAMRLEDQAMFGVTDTQVRHRQPARLDDLAEVTVR